jgi:hypothetical protein
VNNMQKSSNNQEFERKLKEELDWYTLYASEEEYDEKAVESILYLLDRWDPLEEDVIPSEKEAWVRFQEVIKNQQELLPVPETSATSMRSGGKGGFRILSSGLKKKSGMGKKSSRIVNFVYRHKLIAAVVVLFMVLLMGNTIYAVTNPENGFFFWMKRDDSGVEMFTSPEGLDGSMEKIETIFYDRESVPEWAKEWVGIEANMELPEEYEWQYYEANEMENRQHVASHYLLEGEEKEIVLGVWIYMDQVSYFREEFLEYSYLDSYSIEKDKMNIYKKSEKTGENFYIICFYEESCKFYIRGQDNLDELKELVKTYLQCVKKGK